MSCPRCWVSVGIWQFSQHLSVDVSPSLITCSRPWWFLCDLTTSPPHSFLELHTFSSRKAKCLTLNATDKSQASLQRTELYLVSSPSIYKFKSVILWGTVSSLLCLLRTVMDLLMMRCSKRSKCLASEKRSVQCCEEPTGQYHEAVISADAQRPVTREMMEDFLV